MKILLIGADGQLGTDINKVFTDATGIDLIPLTERDIDVKDKERTEYVVRSHGPEMIVNTAAYVNVDACEEDIETPFRVNALSQVHLCRLCREMDIRYVWFSTDYVFDGKQSKPYAEADTPRPINMYGISKLTGEHIIQSILKKYYIIRVCGLYGTAGPIGKKFNFVDAIWERAKKGEALSVVDDQRLTPTSTWDVANKLIELIQIPDYGRYHMTNTGECSWFEFAQEIVRLGGFNCEMNPVRTGYFGERALRPAYSVMDNVHLRAVGLQEMRPWEEALRDYLDMKYLLSREDVM